MQLPHTLARGREITICKIRIVIVQVSHAYGTTSTYAYDWNRRSDVPAVREIVHIGARLAICAFSQIRKQENGQ